MLLRRVTEHVKTQNWFAVLLDFLIVVIGVFMGLLWLSAAARRYRRPDRPAFDAAWGTLLLIIWLIPGGLGIVRTGGRHR